MMHAFAPGSASMAAMRMQTDPRPAPPDDGARRPPDGRRPWSTALLALLVAVAVLAASGCGTRDDGDTSTEWSATVTPVPGVAEVYNLVLSYRCYSSSGELIESRKIPQVRITPDKEFHEILGGPTKGSDSYSVTGMLIKGSGKIMLDLRFVSLSSHGQMIVSSTLTL